MKFTADLHIHSKYSRATSRDCVPEMLELWARRKGLDVIGTGDFTHPAWRKELEEKLTPAEEGLYVLKDEYRVDERAVDGTTVRFSGGASARGWGAAAFDSDGCRPRFILSAEISSIYKKGDKVRKVHNVILLPGLEEAERLSLRLEQIGNLHSDGRPILGLSSRDLLEITLDVCPEAIFIPAHIWTPHFSLFGAYSGFDRIEECFEDLTGHIHALETGLSSDPAMNWRISALDRFTLVSNSDAHSPSRLAREANVFSTELSYSGISDALSGKNPDGFLGTLEFYPEEGKYHLDGHRNCKICLTPAETIQAGGICPVCGRRITVGVLHRIEELADRAEGFRPEGAKDFESIIPLPETVAASLGITPASRRAQGWYEELLRAFGSELFVLREAPLEEVERLAGPCIAEGIRRLRSGQVTWKAGYDGEYGRVTLLEPSEIAGFSGQMSFLPPGLSLGKKGGKRDGESKEGGRKREEKKGIGQETGLSPESSGKAVPEETEGEGGHYGLNREQWEAVTVQDRAIAVIAGPGTGKTRTLTCRIRYLIEERGVPPEEITAVTFTNQAAAEMRKRLEEELSDKKTARRVHIGTFHSICLKLLVKWRGEFHLLDEEEALSLAEEIGEGEEGNKNPREILRLISEYKNGLEGDEDGKAPDLSKPEGRLYGRYSDRLEEMGALDFDDLILETLRAFESETREARKERKGFRWLLADEFQDINRQQLRLLSAWNRGGKEIFVIGDPDQAIYGFRGADPLCFSKFEQEFAGEHRTVRLLRNYRSTPEILGCALAVIGAGAQTKGAEEVKEIGETGEAGEKRQLLTGGPLSAPGESPDDHRLLAERRSGGKVKLLTAGTPFAEALYVAKEINRMVGGVDMLDAQLRSGETANLGFSDIAVLYRTHRQEAVLEECLKKEGIPYIVSGKDTYLAEKEVREALSFFRCLLKEDEASRQTAERRLGSERLTSMKEKFESLPIKKEKPWKLLDLWIEENGLEDSTAMERLRNTAVFHKTMEEFLLNLSLGQEGDVRRSGGRTYRRDAVSLMTFHGSKGLEFPAVFLCGVREGVVPLYSPRRESDVEEERRLFYVGLTRAREQLLLLTSGQTSVFLSEFPEALTEREVLRRPAEDQGKQMSMF